MAKKDPSKEIATTGAADAPVATGIPARRQVSRSPDFVSLYANDIQINTSPWDLRFIFGELSDAVAGPDPSIAVSQIGELRISPQLAKKLVQLLAMQLAAYERTFGVIPDVPVNVS